MSGGLSAQIGFIEQTTDYETAESLTSAVFLEFLNESLDHTINYLDSDALGAGRSFRRSSRRIVGSEMGNGSITYEIGRNGFGLLFAHALGDDNPTSGLDGGASSAYLHEFVLSDPPADYALTIQKGVPQVSTSTIDPYTFVGCKITGWSLSQSVDAFAEFTIDIDARQVLSATGLQAASITDSPPFSFKEAALTVDGSPAVAVNSVDMTFDAGLKTDRFFLGSAGLKAAPISNGFPTLTGSFTVDYEDAADYYDVYAGNTEVDLVVTYTDTDPNAIESGHTYEFSVAVGAIRLDGEAPKVGGPELVQQTINWTALDNGTDDPLTITYKTTDATP